MRIEDVRKVGYKMGDKLYTIIGYGDENHGR